MYITKDEWGYIHKRFWTHDICFVQPTDIHAQAADASSSLSGSVTKYDIF